MELRGKTAIITGASDGVGRETALRLASENLNLVLMARSEDKLKEVESECKIKGCENVKYYSCDLTDNGQLQSVVQKITSDFATIDILINIAGIWQKLNFLENIPGEEVEKVVAINLTSPIQLTRLMLPYLKERPESTIINFVSRSGVTARPGQTIYCASKWGLYGFTETLKVDLEDTNVRVAGIYPAGIKTKILEKAGDKISMEHYSDPKDIAEVIAFMLTRPKNLWLHDVRIVY